MSTLLNHAVEPGEDLHEPLRELSVITTGEGLPGDFFGLLTSVRMQHLCILQYDFVTVFISAGIHRDLPGRSISSSAAARGCPMPHSRGNHHGKLRQKSEALIKRGHTVCVLSDAAIVFAKDLCY